MTENFLLLVRQSLLQEREQLIPVIDNYEAVEDKDDRDLCEPMEDSCEDEHDEYELHEGNYTKANK